MIELLEENRDIFDEAVQFVNSHPHPNCLALQKRFQLNVDRAMNLVDVIEERELWPRCEARQGDKRVCTLKKGHTRGHIFEV